MMEKFRLLLKFAGKIAECEKGEKTFSWMKEREGDGRRIWNNELL